MSGINLNFTEEKTRLPIGVSKLFGNPDIWDGFIWPQFTESGEEYEMPFICQINCEQAVVYDNANVLPKTGMLYFFYDMDGMPREPFGSSKAKVIYYNGDMSGLHKMLLTDHEGNDMSLPELEVRFDAGDSPKGILGQTDPQDWQPLFKLFSFETEKLSIRFPDNGILYFFIDKDKLASMDFADIKFEVRKC